MSPYRETLVKLIRAFAVPGSLVLSGFRLLTLFLKLTWPYGVFFTLMWGQARLGPPYPNPLLVVTACIGLLLFDRLIIPAIADWNADRRERLRVRKIPRRERFKKWLFPAGPTALSHRLILVDQTLYRAWARNFDAILGHPAPIGYMIPCRWPSNARLQPTALRIIADRLRAVGLERTVMYPAHLERVQQLLMTELHATRHTCAFWRFVPGHHEYFAVKLHGSY